MVRPARPRVPVIVGPTASGKSAVALHLALILDAEIVSADARQVYQEMEIGTAKPTPEDLRRVPHHCINLIPPDREFSAGQFGPVARAAVMDIVRRGKVPLIVGGSGLYIRAAVDGLFEGPACEPAIRAALDADVTAGKLADLVRELREVDPDTAARIDTRNPRRVVRALEVYRCSGVPLSVLQRTAKEEVPFDAVFYGVRRDRMDLYHRIEKRCDEMISRGLLEEAAALLRKGYSPRLPSLATVGYVEAFDHLMGKTTREEMVKLFKQNSRRYAKRQLTWFRADTRIRWVEMKAGRSEADAAAEIHTLFAASRHSMEESR